MSDRIAIMNHGEIKCRGSPHFLKKFYGNGFRVKIIKNHVFDWREFNDFLDENNFASDFRTETNVADEIELSISFDKVDVLTSFLKEIETNKDALGLDSYSVSTSTMEEVFLK